MDIPTTLPNFISVPEQYRLVVTQVLVNSPSAKDPPQPSFPKLHDQQSSSIPRQSQGNQLRYSLLQTFPMWLPIPCHAKYQDTRDIPKRKLSYVPSRSPHFKSLSLRGKISQDQLIRGNPLQNSNHWGMSSSDYQMNVKLLYAQSSSSSQLSVAGTLSSEPRQSTTIRQIRPPLQPYLSYPYFVSRQGSTLFCFTFIIQPSLRAIRSVLLLSPYHRHDSIRSHLRPSSSHPFCGSFYFSNLREIRRYIVHFRR
ncbi:unnamed protein product [Vicia faba]|uniref:Uncharacterized protein n=1 Tax=Vicia faba TaxID=3906 RepID=A0AAV1A8F3_VICFA|nr:unnamed protein product [Vicia faba]